MIRTRNYADNVSIKLDPVTGAEYVVGSPFLPPVPTTNVFVSAAGSDANPGTQAAPFATVAKAESLIPPVATGSFRIHLNAGDHLLPTRGTFIRPRTLQDSLIEVFADDDWDPTVVTQFAAGAALAGTTDSVVKAAALGLNVYEGKTIEITSVGGVPVPLALRERRHVRNNTATDIIPVEAFINAPVVGDTYRILDLNCALLAPDLGGPLFDTYQLIGDCICPVDNLNWSGSDYFFGGPPPAVSLSGVSLRGINLKPGPSFGSFTFGRLPLYAFGLEGPVNPATNWFLMDTNIAMGFGLPEFLRFTGWGIAHHNATGILALARSSQIFGYLWTAADVPEDVNQASNTNVVLYGGRARSLRVAPAFGSSVSSRPTIYGGFLGAFIPFLFRVSGGNWINSVSVEAMNPLLFDVEVQNAGSAPDVLIQGTSSMRMSGNVSGIGAVRAERGARIYLYGTPQFGDPVALDYSVPGAAPVNKSFFGAAGVALVGTDGSLIVRVV